MDVAGRIEIVRELCSFERRRTGTDAERRAANRLAERLRELGRRAEIEPIHVHPQVGLVLGLHALVGFAGSLIAVEVPALGFGLVLAAALSLYLDLNARLYLLRRLFFRRASQNVVSPGDRPRAPARLVLVAHYDAGRGGWIYARGRARALARLARRLRLPLGPTRLLFWSLALLLPILGARMAGLDSQAISLIQLPPTLVLLVAIFLAVDVALSDVVAGANDNASGVATALSLADELRREPPEGLDVWVVLTAGEESLAQGMRAFVRAHRADLDPASTYVVNLDEVGRGDVRWVVGEGGAVTYDLDPGLARLCAAIAEADREGDGRYRPAPLRRGWPSDALPARLARIPATTITCLGPEEVVPADHHLPSDRPNRIDGAALERAHSFALELIRLLDRDVTRRTRRERDEREDGEAVDEPDRPKAGAGKR